MWNMFITMFSSALANPVNIEHNFNSLLIILVANSKDTCTLMPVTHLSGSQSKQHIFTFPGTGLNMGRLELKKYRNGEDGKYYAKRWESSANKRVILLILHEFDIWIDNLEHELLKMNHELDHMKTMRKCLAYDIVSIGLAVKGVELTEKSILSTKSVQREDEQYKTDQQQVRELEEARAVEMIFDDQKYNKVMELMPCE